MYDVSYADLENSPEILRHHPSRLHGKICELKPPIAGRRTQGRDFNSEDENQSLAAGNRSAFGRLSDGNRRFPIGNRLPKWGARKYYLLLHQPESGRCRLQVTLLDLTIREKSENKRLRKRLRRPPGATKQALKLYRERFGGDPGGAERDNFVLRTKIPPLGAL